MHGPARVPCSSATEGQKTVEDTRPKRAAAGFQVRKGLALSAVDEGQFVPCGVRRCTREICDALSEIIMINAIIRLS